MSSTSATATYTLQLNSSGLVAGVGAASSALESLRSKLAADQRALGEMQKAMNRLKAGGMGKSAAFDQLRNQSTALKASIAGTQAEVLSLGGAFGANEKKAATWLDKLAEAGGPAGGLAQQATKLFGSLSSGLGIFALATTGVLALGAAFVSVWSSIGQATIAFTQFALASASAARSERLHLEGLTTLRFAFHAAHDSAAALVGTIDAVSASSALSRSEVARYTEQLYRMGLRGQNLRDAVEGATIAASVQGERYGQRFAGMAAGAARSGRSVRALADDIRNRLGGIATRQALTLDVQIQRLRQDLTSLFASVRIETFLGEVREVLSVFSATSISGRALRTLFGALFSGLSDGTRGTGAVIRSFMEGLVIGSLRIALLLLDVRDAWRSAFGPVSSVLRPLVGDLDAVRLATGAGVLVVGALALSFGVAAIGIAAVLSPLVAVGLALTALTTRAQSFFAIDWSTQGESMVDGLVAGIMGGRDRLLTAVQGLATGATSALTSALQIRSPSRVFADLGAQIPAGLAQGVERRTPIVSMAVGNMSDSAAKGAGRTALGASRTSTTTIGPFYIEVNGGTESDGQDLQNQLTSIFEGLASTTGAR